MADPLALADCEFVSGLTHPDGAKFDMLPGDRVTVEVTAKGITANGPGARLRVPWSAVTYLDTRGPTGPEVPFEQDHRHWGRSPFGLLIGNMLTPAPSKWCWLAIGRTDGPELMFRVRGYLQPELEALLEQHSARPDP